MKTASPPSSAERVAELVALGFYVVEVAGIRPDGSCTCRLGAECPSTGKHPLGSGWQNRATRTPKIYERWTRSATTPRNLGLFPKKGSGLMVIDRDDPTVDLPLPPTLTVTRASAPEGRGHYYYRLPVAIADEDVPRVFAGGEVRVAGSGHVVAPGSRHVSGDMLVANDLPVALVTPELIEAIRSRPPVRVAWGGNGPEAAGEGTRHGWLIGQARRFRGAGFDQEDIANALIDLDVEYFDGSFVDEYGEDEVERMASWAVANIAPDRPVTITFTKGGKRARATAAPSSVTTSPVFPEEALVGVLGEIVRLYEPTTEGSASATWAGAAAYLSAFVGRDAHFRLGAKSHTAAVYPVVVGPTASGKGVSQDVTRWLADFLEPSSSPLRKAGVSSGEGIVWAVRDDKDVWDPKAQAFVTRPGAADKRLLLLEAEFGKVLRVGVRAGSTLPDIIRLAWDGEPLSVLTKGEDGGYESHGAHVVMLGNITPGELTQLLTATDEVSGFGNRFLFLDQRRERRIPFPPDLDGGEERRVRAVVQRSVAKATTRPYPMHLSADAQALWDSVYDDLAVSDDTAAARMTERARTYALRIAFLYALLDADNDYDVQEDHLAAGVAVARSSRATVERFMKAKRPVGRDEAKVLAALAANGRVTRTEVSHGLLGRNRGAEQVNALRDDLVGRGVIVVAMNGNVETWTRG